jgi:hypothetical protein
MSNYLLPTRRLIRTDGTTLDIGEPIDMLAVEIMLGANCDCFDTVLLADGIHVMILDDLGHRKGLPLNKAATLLYWERCGGPNDHCIVGDVVIAPDSDFQAKGVDHE